MGSVCGEIKGSVCGETKFVRRWEISLLNEHYISLLGMVMLNALCSFTGELRPCTL